MSNEIFFVADRQLRRMISLPSKADAVTFLDREEKLWSWIDDSIQNYGAVNGVVGRYRPENWIQRFRNALNENTKDVFEQAMRERYGGQQCICSIDPEAHAIAVISETDKMVAAVALATIHGEAPTADRNFMRDIKYRIGVAHGNSLMSGLDPSIASGSIRALNQARIDIDLEMQRASALIDSAKKVSDKNADEITAAAHALGIAHSADFSKIQSERAEAFSKLRDNLEATTKAYEVRMELQAPVAYWRKRALQYRSLARRALSLLIIFTVAAVVGLYCLYDSAASHLPTDATTVPYAALFRASAFALLMTSIVFWIGRVLLRIYLSAHHLETDAEERRTMVTTFLALTRKSLVTDEDKKFILAALFRPGTDEIVKEEAAPDTMFAALMGGILKR
jgi:hypothetical protein